MHTDVVTVEIDLAEAPKDASDAYLRLHLLSHRLVRPHGLNVDGIFGKLANVVWTSVGPCAVTGLRGGPPRAASQRPGAGLRRGQVPPDDRLRAADRGPHRRRRPGAARRPPRRGHHGDARGLRATTTPARWAPRWSRAGSAPAWWSATVPTSAAAPRSWAPCPVAAPPSSPSASAACSAPTPASASRWVTTASSRPGCYVTAGTKVTIKDMDSKPKVIKASELSGAEQRAVPPQLGHRRRRGTAVGR